MEIRGRLAARGFGALALWVALTPACGGSGSTTPTGSTAETLSLRVTTAHFRIFAGGASDAMVQDVAGRLEAAFPRVVADLEAGSPRPVSVRIWQDEASFTAELERYFGRRLPATGYVTGPEEVRVLASARVATSATHEFCHVVSLWVNPAFANNPRWLWESVALFENGELVDPRSLAYLVSGRYPTLAELDADITASRQIYEVGYLIAQFVVERWGRPELIRLIRSNGDIAGTLGLSTPAFEEAWYAFVRERYLS